VSEGREAVVVEAVRTPRTRAGKGAFRDVRSIDLLVSAVRGLGARVPFDENMVDDVVVGCATQVRDQGANLAKVAAVYGGFAPRASGVTVNRFCASGLEALHQAAAAIAFGSADCVLAAGVESLSRVPLLADEGAWFTDPDVAARAHGVPLVEAADRLAYTEIIARAELDAWAEESHRRALAHAGASARLVPVTSRGLVIDARDEGPREGLTAAKLASLAPLRAEIDPERAVHTVATAPGLVDGAAAALVCARSFAERHGLPIRARIRCVSHGVADPAIMLTGMVPAARKLLAQAGLAARDVGVYELNESFAAPVVHAVRTLDLDPRAVNARGGALALGHPLGATGVALLATALDRFEAGDGPHAILAIPGGAGLAMAVHVEREAR
jgi:acetyl-CoA C-acetyltransferase